MRVDIQEKLRELERLQLEYLEAERVCYTTEILSYNEQETHTAAVLCDLARSKRNWRAGQLLGDLLRYVRELEGRSE